MSREAYEKERQKQINAIRPQEWFAFTKIFNLMYGVDTEELNAKKIELQAQAPVTKLLLPKTSPIKIFDVVVVHEDVEVPQWN